MSQNYHTEFGDADVVDIPSMNERFSDLDSAIATQAAAATPIKVALLTDSKSTGTAGGAASATTWHTRDLNTKVDTNSIVTLASNRFTPISGTYVIIATAPGAFVNLQRLRLYNYTQDSVELYGLNGKADSGSSGAVQPALLQGTFSANGTDAYRIDHYCQSAKATDGLGVAVSDGSPEIYTTVLLMRVGD